MAELLDLVKDTARISEMELKPWGSQGGFHGRVPLDDAGLFQGKSHLEMDKRTGGTPIDASWFIKILWTFGWWLGVPLWLRKALRCHGNTLGYPLGTSWLCLEIGGIYPWFQPMACIGEGKWWHPYTSFGLGGPCLRAALHWCVIFCDGDGCMLHSDLELTLS